MFDSLYLRSRSGDPQLRVGLLLDSALLPACFAEVVGHIQRCNFARLELLAFNAEERRKPIDSLRKRPILPRVTSLFRDRRRRKSILYALYDRWDRFGTDQADNPLALVDCSAHFTGVESIWVLPKRTRFVHRLAASDVEIIRTKRLDVLIRFGFNILRGEVLSAAKYGVWSYHHGDGDQYRGGPAYFWELVEKNPISGVMLQVLTEELDAGRVLCKGYFATEPGLSRKRNCIQPYWGASTYIIRKLHELHEGGWSKVESKIVPSKPYTGRKKIYTLPSNRELLQWLVPTLVAKTMRLLVRRPSVKHWRLAIRSTTQLLGTGEPSPTLDDFRWIESPRGRYYADPFLIDNCGQSWLFFEDFDYASDRGRISCAQVRDGQLGPVTPVLERPYHLSYPCVFRARGEIFMVPESGANGTVELYRCTRFPDQWRLEGALLDRRAVDTTVWFRNGLYWFFTTLQEQRGMGTQLWLFHSKQLGEPWIPHPANPISTDTRNKRGAGAIIERDGKLFRPSQSGANGYGRSFTLNEIVRWDEDEYVERPQLTVEPLWAPGLVGTHSYSQLGNVEIIDGCVAMPRNRVVDPP